MSITCSGEALASALTFILNRSQLSTFEIQTPENDWIMGNGRVNPHCDGVAYLKQRKNFYSTIYNKLQYPSEKWVREIEGNCIVKYV